MWRKKKGFKMSGKGTDYKELTASRGMVFDLKENHKGYNAALDSYGRTV